MTTMNELLIKLLEKALRHLYDRRVVLRNKKLNKILGIDEVRDDLLNFRINP